MRKIRQSKRINESYYEINHKSGLKIVVYPMANFKFVYCMLSVKYGAINTCFMGEKGEKINLPLGTAHFLEHKAFENEEEDAFALLSALGADANAYTSAEKTVYYFSCTHNWEKCLEILLRHIQKPAFSKESVDREREIILQEIRMFDDDCDWLVYKNLLEAMFFTPVISSEIAGNENSIREIDKNILEICHRHFYNLHNMTLVAAGNVGVDKIEEIADKILMKSEEVKAEKVYETEPEEIKTDYTESCQTIAAPIFNIGFKMKNQGKNTIKNQMIDEMLLDIIAGDITGFYKELYDSGIINSTFDADVYSSHYGNALIFMGESRNPTQLKKLLMDRIDYLKKNGIDKRDFNCLKKAAYGKYISMFSSAESIANAAAMAEEYGECIYNTIDIAADLSPADLEERLNNCLFAENSVLSIVKTKLEDK